MDQQAGGENIGTQRNQDDIGNPCVNTRPENGSNAQDNSNEIQSAFVHPSYSDVIMNKSDSDDGLFVTDSSDDIMNDVMSDFSPTKDRMEQTRETIMESLVQSFVSVTPATDNVNSACETNKFANEFESTNDGNDFDAIDKMSVKEDMKTMQTMIPMRRIPSDSAFPEIGRKVSDLASAAGSDEYVTIGSASEPTNVSFFSQSASTSQLPAAAKPGPYERSKSVSSFHSKQKPDEDNNYPAAVEPACNTVTNHWLLDDGWLKKSNSDPQQIKQAISGSEKIKTPLENTLTTEQSYVNDTHPDSGTKPPDNDSQPKQERKPQAKSISGKPTFKATKLPRFYHQRSEVKMASSRSESCVIPKVNPFASENVTIRRSRSSNTRYLLSPMTRSTTNERQSRKDAGGVSYAVKHCASPEHSTTAKQSNTSYKMKPPAVSRSPDGERSTPSQEPFKASACRTYSKPYVTRNEEDGDPLKQKQRTNPRLCASDAHTSGPGFRDKSKDASKNDRSSSNNRVRSKSAASHPISDKSKLPQRARSPIKVIKTRSATGEKTAESLPEKCIIGQKTDGAVTPEQAVSSSSKMLLKRPTPSPRAKSSSVAVAVPAALVGAENAAAVPVSSGAIEQSGVGAGLSRQAETATAPALVSLQVNVSVRAEDGSVHSFRDSISPPQDGGTGDLFSGVEELIRGLLEAPAPACDGHGRLLTAAPVSAFSPRNVTPQSPRRGTATEVSASAQRPVPNIRPATAARRKQRELGGEFPGRHTQGALDMYAQRLQAEESVFLLTSSGSMSSTDLWPQAARQLVYPFTTIPVISVVPKRPEPRQSSVRTCQDVDEEERNGRDEETPMSNCQEPCFSQSQAEPVSVNATSGEPQQCHSPASPLRSAPSAPPPSPVRLMSAPSSPGRARTPSPRSRTPIPQQMVSEGAVRSSRSPTPERHSLYQTAQTTPELRRSATPDSLRSVGGSSGGSSGSLLSLKRSPRVAELLNFRSLSPARSNKTKDRGRSQSSSPRSAQSSPRRHSPFGHRDCNLQRSQTSKRSSPVSISNETFLQTDTGKTAGGDIIWAKRLPDGLDPSVLDVGSIPVEAKPAKHVTTDMTPLTSFSGVQLQGASSDDHQVSAAIACNSFPKPMKRFTSETFVPQQDGVLQKPIPQKRTKHTPSVRPDTSHSRTEEEPTISGKTSFCSMDSPLPTRSPLPPTERKVRKSANGTDGDPLSNQNPDGIQISSVEAAMKQKLVAEQTGQPKLMMFGSLDINSPDSDRRSSSSSADSASPRSVRYSLSSQHFSDETKTIRTPAQPHWQQQMLKKDDYVVAPNLEREMIETENTVKLMEETISVLERQHDSLITNTKEISEKINQERSRKCDLKTAKMMLQKVRMELQKTTQNSEDNRMQLLNAKERISEQESAIFLLKESLREECIKNVRMERSLRQRVSSAEGNKLTSQHPPEPSEVERREQTGSSPLAEHSSVRELLEETEKLLQEERRARKDVEEKLAQEKSRKLRILNAAKKWRQQLEADAKPADQELDSSDWHSKVVFLPGVSESDSPNMKRYQSIHRPGYSDESMKTDPTKYEIDEAVTSGQVFDVELAFDSDYVVPKLTGREDVACQCEIMDDASNWKEKYVKMKQIHDSYVTDMNEVQRDRMKLGSELQLLSVKLKEETEKKDRFEHEFKNLVDRIHEMQRDVELYQEQSKEQLATLKQGDNKIIENLELEKLKLKDYYQQQMETIVQEKVSEFQDKVAHLEAIVREQINTYTKSMQQKFREKLATASLQQKEVISRLEVEHSKEVERLTAEYPQEIERLQQRLTECRREVVDKENRLEQRETQVSTILRVVKLLIKEGNAMKGDAKEQNTVEIARKILRCMDLNLDDIVSPRPRLTDHHQQDDDREYVTKNGSCVTFRSIPDSPRPTPASRATRWKNPPPVPPRRKATSNSVGRDSAPMQMSDESTASQPFHVSDVAKKEISYIRFGDEVIRAKSKESLQNDAKTQAKQTFTTSELSEWGDSGSWMLSGALPVAPPPTPPSVTATITSTGTNADETDLVPRESADGVSVLKGLERPARVKSVADKGTGSANSLIRDPSFLLLSNSVIAEDEARMCQCKRLQHAIEEYSRLRMTAAHRNRLKEGPLRRDRTRSSSETSVSRLASSYFETIKGTRVFETKLVGARKLNVSSLSSEQHSLRTQAAVPKLASKANSNSNQVLGKEMRKTLTVATDETGGKFSSPSSFKPVSLRPVNNASENIASKPPIQNVGIPPSRPATGHFSSPACRGRTIENVAGTTSAHAEVERSRSRPDTPGFVEKTTSPSRNVAIKTRKTAPTLKRMPSFDKVDMPECKESSEGSKFALPGPPSPLEPKPRDNRASIQRKQLAAMRKHSPNERERRHSISPRERKLFALRSQQNTEKVTRTEVTKRTLSPAPLSPQRVLPVATALDQTRRILPTYRPRRDRSRSGRRSASSGMDWKKYIKSGQPWQDVYLHEHSNPDYVEPILTNGTYYSAKTRNEDSDRSGDWSPSYSWAPPRRGERDKWSRYLATGHAAEQIALERFYATPERESADGRRRMRRSQKKAEVLEHISRLLTVSSGSEPSDERTGRPAERGARRSRSHQPARTEHRRDRCAVLEDVRRKALGQLGTRHPSDPLADLPGYRAPSDRGTPHPQQQQQRVSLSLDRELPIPRRDGGVHQRLPADVKTHQRLAREYCRKQRHSSALERSASQQRWSSDSRRKVPLALGSRTSRGETVPPERRRYRSHSRSRYGTAAAALDELAMDSWVDRWERKWDRERRQRPSTHHWHPT